MENEIRDRVVTRLAELGLKPSSFELRAALEAEGFNGTYLYELVAGRKKGIPRTKIARLAKVLKVDPEYLTGQIEEIGIAAGPGVKIVGICEAGAWREPSIVTLKGPAISPDPRVSAESQVAYLVRGNHAENLGIGDASIIVIGKGVIPRSGEIVAVERTREDGTKETSLRKVDDVNFAAQEDGKETIIGVVLFAIRTF